MSLSDFSLIRQGKSYRRRVEEQLQQNDLNGVWRSLKTISGHNNSRPELTRDHEWVNDLGRFFNRFDQPVTLPPTQPAPLQSPPIGTSATTSLSTLTPLSAAPLQPPCALTTRPKPLTSQLCGIVEHIYDMSLRLQKVPQLWKTSCVVPVPKSQ